MKTHNVQIIRRYQHEKWALAGIVVFMGAYGLLQLFPVKIISPCQSTGCIPSVVYAQDNLSIEEQVILAGLRKFGVKHLESLRNIVFHESTFNPKAVNPTSGACGLFQFYPCSKLKCQTGDYQCQIDAGLSYIQKRYGDPNKAWEFWQEHNWY
jgi:hypothetical protein